MLYDIVDELEGELSQAVEVRNPEKLHRYVVRMVEKLQPSQEHNSVIVEILSEIRAINTRIGDMQHQMDKRFETMQHSMDKRFDDMHQAMNNRFDDMNKRFNGMQALIGLGFTVLATMMTVIRIFG